MTRLLKYVFIIIILFSAFFTKQNASAYSACNPQDLTILPCEYSTRTFDTIFVKHSTYNYTYYYNSENYTYTHDYYANTDKYSFPSNYYGRSYSCSTVSPFNCTSNGDLGSFYHDYINDNISWYGEGAPDEYKNLPNITSIEPPAVTSLGGDEITINGKFFCFILSINSL